MTDTEQAILTEGSSIALHSLTHSVAMADGPRAGHRRAVDGRLGDLDNDPGWGIWTMTQAEDPIQQKISVYLTHHVQLLGESEVNRQSAGRGTTRDRQSAGTVVQGRRPPRRKKVQGLSRK